MALKDIFKVNRKTFFAPGDWLGYNILRSQTAYIWAIFKTILGPFFSLPKVKRVETFAEAIERLNLTENDIKESEQTYWMYAVFFGLAGLGAAIVSIVFLLQGSFISSFIGVGVTALILSQAFRYHFWHFEIKHRKLGCTFEEWRAGKIRSEDEPR